MNRRKATASILLCAAGRRPYLVRWFREALAANGLHGTVIVADADAHSAAGAIADAFIVSPRITDPGYEPWLRTTLHQFDVDLALSFNDFELSFWSSIDPALDALMTLRSAEQRLVEDKWSLASAASRVGISMPRTWLGSDLLSTPGIDSDVLRFVVKSRFGSGSVGLRFAEREDLEDAIIAASSEVLDQRGVRVATVEEGASLVVVQEEVRGQEFGVDVVADFERQYVTCIAREKLSMRGGETDKAITTDPAPFSVLASSLSSLTQHRGLIDTDVIADSEGRPWLIDVNPRFGGGYPFSHVGGSNVPAAVVAWSTGHEAKAEWLQSAPGVLASKSIDIVRLRTAT